MGEDTSQAIDAVLLSLGWRGRYQVLQLIQLLMCVFPLAFNILSIVFIGKANEHKCRALDNATSHLWPPAVVNVTYEQCSVTWHNFTGETMKAPCPNGLEFREPLDRSMMSEWNLVCENEALTDVSQTLLLAGMMVGAVLFTSLSDKYGRKPFHIGCHIGLMTVGLASAFVPSFLAFLPLRFFQGAFQQGTGLCCGILCMEILPARHRFTQSVIGAFLWAFGMVVLAFIAYLMRDVSWRYLQIAFAGFSLYCILQIWFTDESIRWLVANGKIKQAERILKRAAAMNKVSEAEVLGIFRSKVLRQQSVTSEKPVGDHKHDLAADSAVNGGETQTNLLVPEESPQLAQYSFVDFFRHKYVFLCTVINGFAWIVNAMTYYGLSMTSVSLADDMYLGFFLSAVVELPTAVIFCCLVERIGRKKCCDIFHIMAGLSLLVSVTISSLAGEGEAVKISVLVLALFGKFAISVTFAVLFLYTPEQFPTNLRNASLGVASMSGRVGAMIAPYSRTLSRHYPWATGTIFGVFCLLVPLSMRMLPETCGRELPQTIQEMTIYITTPYEVTYRKQKYPTKKNKNAAII